jgi:dihydroorotate dehydrogenase electron transfer subunit
MRRGLQVYQGKCRIISNEEVMPAVNLLKVDAPEIASGASPGQFAMISCDSGCGRLLRRPISFQQVDGHTLAFLFASIGEGTQWLAGRKTGDLIDILGPLGRGFSLDSNKRLLLIAGGMGIAPLCFLAERAISKINQVKMLVGAKTASLLCPASLIPRGVELITATEDGTAGVRGLVTSLLPEYLPSSDQVFICGPLPMYQAIQRNYRQYLANIPVEVSLEVRMGCGLGFCYACTIKTSEGLKQVCKDGPVFNMNEVIWEEMS